MNDEHEINDDLRYFVLSQDVTVPANEFNVLESRWGEDKSFVISEGSRFVLREGEYWTYEKAGYALDAEQASIVKPFLVEVKGKIGQWLESCGEGAYPVLAALGELGIVTEEDIERAAYRVILSYTDKVHIMHRNWVISYEE